MSDVESRDNERTKQIEFPPDETHVKGFERAMIVISLVCVVVVLYVIMGTDLGDTFRPQL